MPCLVFSGTLVLFFGTNAVFLAEALICLLSSLRQKNMPVSKNLEGNSAKVGHSTMSLDRASVRKLGGKIKSFGESESYVTLKSIFFDIYFDIY